MAEIAPSSSKLLAGSLGALLVGGALIASIFLGSGLLGAAHDAEQHALMLAVLGVAIVGLCLLGVGFMGLGARYGGHGGAAGTLLWLGALGGVMVFVSLLGEAGLLTVGLVLLSGGLGLGGIVAGLALFATPVLGKVAGVCVLLAGGVWTFMAVACLVPTLLATVVELHLVLVALGVIGGAIGYLMAGAQMLRARKA